jgi:uncharacterized GH25 family protein
MLNLRKSLFTVAAIAAALAPAAYAHRAWMLPSTTVVSGEDNWITVDAAASNDLFFADHRPLAAVPVLYLPDGSVGAIENHKVGAVRATFDVHLTQQGTYRVAIESNTVFGTYVLNGETKQLPRGTTPATLAAAIPAGATDVKTAEMSSRNEIYLTQGQPTLTVFKPSGKGIEMVPVTHPSDLFAGQAATFQFLLDGKPAAGLAVTAIPGGVRYRDKPNEIHLTTDANGKVTITWPTPGMYWVNVTQARSGEEGERPTPSAIPTRRVNYMTTLEVLAP